MKKKNLLLFITRQLREKEREGYESIIACGSDHISHSHKFTSEVEGAPEIVQVKLPMNVSLFVELSAIAMPPTTMDKLGA